MLEGDASQRSASRCFPTNRRPGVPLITLCETDGHYSFRANGQDTPRDIPDGPDALFAALYGALDDLPGARNDRDVIAHGCQTAIARFREAAADELLRSPGSYTSCIADADMPLLIPHFRQVLTEEERNNDKALALPALGTQPTRIRSSQPTIPHVIAAKIMQAKAAKDRTDGDPALPTPPSATALGFDALRDLQLGQRIFRGLTATVQNVLTGPNPTFNNLTAASPHPPLTDDTVTRTWLETRFASSKPNHLNQDQVMHATTPDFKNLLKSVEAMRHGLARTLPDSKAKEDILKTMDAFPTDIVTNTRRWYERHMKWYSPDRKTAIPHVDEQTFGFMVADFFRDMSKKAYVASIEPGTPASDRQRFESAHGLFKELKRKHVTAALEHAYDNTAIYKENYYASKPGGKEFALGQNNARVAYAKVRLGLGIYLTDNVKLVLDLVELRWGRTGNTYTADDLNPATNRRYEGSASIGATATGALTKKITGSIGGTVRGYGNAGGQLKAATTRQATQLAARNRNHEGSRLNSAGPAMRHTTAAYTHALNWMMNFMFGDVAKGEAHSTHFGGLEKTMRGRQNEDRIAHYAHELCSRSGLDDFGLERDLARHFPTASSKLEGLLTHAEDEQRLRMQTLAAKQRDAEENEEFDRLTAAQQSGKLGGVDSLTVDDLKRELDTGPSDGTEYAALVKNRVTDGFDLKMSNQYRLWGLQVQLRAGLNDVHFDSREEYKGSLPAHWKPTIARGIEPPSLGVNATGRITDESTSSQRLKPQLLATDYLANFTGFNDIHSAENEYQAVYRESFDRAAHPDAVHPSLHLGLQVFDPMKMVVEQNGLGTVTAQQLAAADPQKLFGTIDQLMPHHATALVALHEGTLDANQYMETLAELSEQLFDTYRSYTHDANRLWALRGKPEYQAAFDVFNERYFDGRWRQTGNTPDEVAATMAHGYGALWFAHQTLGLLTEGGRHQCVEQLKAMDAGEKARFDSLSRTHKHRMEMCAALRDRYPYAIDKVSALRAQPIAAAAGNQKVNSSLTVGVTADLLGINDFAFLNGLSGNFTVGYANLNQKRHVNKTRQGDHPGVTGLLIGGKPYAEVGSNILALLRKHDVSPQLREFMSNLAQELLKIPAEIANKQRGIGFEIRWQAPANVPTEDGESVAITKQFARLYATTATGINASLPIGLAPPPFSVVPGVVFNETNATTLFYQLGPDPDENLMTFNGPTGKLMTDKTGQMLPYETIAQNFLDPKQALHAKALFSSEHAIPSVVELFRRAAVKEPGPKGAFHRVLYDERGRQVREVARHAVHFSALKANDPLDAPAVADIWDGLKAEAATWQPLDARLLAWLEQCTTAQRIDYFCNNPTGQEVLRRYVTVMQTFVTTNTVDTTASHHNQPPSRRQIRNLPTLDPDRADSRTTAQRVRNRLSNLNPFNQFTTSLPEQRPKPHIEPWRKTAPPTRLRQQDQRTATGERAEIDPALPAARVFPGVFLGKPRTVINEKLDRLEKKVTGAFNATSQRVRHPLTRRPATETTEPPATATVPPASFDPRKPPELVLWLPQDVTRQAAPEPAKTPRVKRRLSPPEIPDTNAPVPLAANGDGDALQTHF